MANPEPRIAPLHETQWDPELRPIADRLQSHYLGLVNLHRLLARNPRQFRPLLTFASRILDSSLPPRIREIIILRTAWARKVPYEWAHHVLVGRAAGLSDAEISSIKEPPAGGAWTDPERALLRAVDELAVTSSISEDLWASLADAFDQIQLMDIVMTVGNYTMLGMALKTFRVPLDPELAGLPENLLLIEEDLCAAPDKGLVETGIAHEPGSAAR